MRSERSLSGTILELASDDEPTAIKAALEIQKLSIAGCESSDIGDEIDAYERNDAYLLQQIAQVFHQDAFPSEQVLRKLLQVFKERLQGGMDFFSKADIMSLPNTDLMALQSAAMLVLRSAGPAAASLRDELVEILKGEAIGNEVFSTSLHQSLACSLLASMGSTGYPAFWDVLKFFTKENDPASRVAILAYCKEEPSLIDALFEKLAQAENEEYIEQLLSLLPMLARQLPAVRPLTLNLLREYVKHNVVDVAVVAADGLVALDAVDETTEQEIRALRIRAISDEKDDECFVDGIDQNGNQFQQAYDPEKLNKAELIRELAAQDPYDKARATEALSAFARDSDVVPHLIAMLDDKDVVHDFGYLSAFALRTLAKSGSLALPALDRVISLLEDCLTCERDTELKNIECGLSGITYDVDCDYEIFDLANVLKAIGPQAGKALPLLNELERYLTLRDASGCDRRVERLRETIIAVSGSETGFQVGGKFYWIR